jgi:hypothetical protein
VGMADGLLSIKDRRKTDHLDPDAHRTSKPKSNNTTFNPYRYVSPNLFNSSNVTTFSIDKQIFLTKISTI